MKVREPKKKTRITKMLDKTTLCSAPSVKSRIAESRDRLYRVALAWCGDEMLADDLVQETMASGISKQKQLRDENRLFAWLYSILNNTWCSYIRKNKPHEDLDEQLPSGESGPCNNCEEIEMIGQVRHIVATLPMVERQVISLVDLDELSYCDVAQALDIPIGTVMSRLHRARKHLLERLENQPAVSTIGKGPIHLVE
jgi:RNA polymerase sigma-70 factor (ECF subfamily)